MNESTSPLSFKDIIASAVTSASSRERRLACLMLSFGSVLSPACDHNHRRKLDQDLLNLPALLSRTRKVDLRFLLLLLAGGCVFAGALAFLDESVGSSEADRACFDDGLSSGGEADNERLELWDVRNSNGSRGSRIDDASSAMAANLALGDEEESESKDPLGAALKEAPHLGTDAEIDEDDSEAVRPFDESEKAVIGGRDILVCF